MTDEMMSLKCFAYLLVYSKCPVECQSLPPASLSGELPEGRYPILAVIFISGILVGKPHILGEQMHPLFINYSKIFACKDEILQQHQ